MPEKSRSPGRRWLFGGFLVLASVVTVTIMTPLALFHPPLSANQIDGVREHCAAARSTERSRTTAARYTAIVSEFGQVQAQFDRVTGLKLADLTFRDVADARLDLLSESLVEIRVQLHALAEDLPPDFADASMQREMEDWATLERALRVEVEARGYRRQEPDTLERIVLILASHPYRRPATIAELESLSSTVDWLRDVMTWASRAPGTTADQLRESREALRRLTPELPAWRELVGQRAATLLAAPMRFDDDVLFAEQRGDYEFAVLAERVDRLLEWAPASWLELWRELPGRIAPSERSFERGQASSRMLAPLQPVAARLMVVVATLRGVQVMLAIREHALVTGALPTGLDALKERAPDLPLDPYSGQPFVYRVTPADFILYSIGYDLQDDGGTSQAKDVIIFR